MTNILTVYTDFVCPWCYIGDAYLQRAVDQVPFTLKYVMYPLHPETPLNGTSLKELFAGRNIDVDASQQAIKEKALSMGLEYGNRTHTFNSRNAQVVGKAMAQHRVFNNYMHAVFHSYFGKGENISSIEVLQAIVDQVYPVDLDVNELIENSHYQKLVDVDWEFCRQNNITGVPTYEYDNRYCVGAQTSDNLLELFNP